MTQEQIKFYVDRMEEDKLEAIKRIETLNSNIYYMQKCCQHEYNKPEPMRTRQICKYCKHWIDNSDDADYY